MKRQIVHIDEDKCNGCGLCVPGCAEGAIQIINGKAKLVADNLCDGLGACLGDCPLGAITIIEREADDFDEVAVEQHLKETDPVKAAVHAGHGHAPAHGGGCPSAQVRSFAKPAAPAHGGGCPGSRVESVPEKTDQGETVSRPSQLRQWPILLHLVPPQAPFLQQCDLLLAADCTSFAYADFHDRLLKGKTLLVGCPKFDNAQAYVEKLTAILQQNEIKSLTVARMEVPCCSGMTQIAQMAVQSSGKAVEIKEVIIGLQGDIKA